MSSTVAQWVNQMNDPNTEVYEALSLPTDISPQLFLSGARFFSVHDAELKSAKLTKQGTLTIKTRAIVINMDTRVEEEYGTVEIQFLVPRFESKLRSVVGNTLFQMIVTPDRCYIVYWNSKHRIDYCEFEYTTIKSVHLTEDFTPFFRKLPQYSLCSSK